MSDSTVLAVVFFFFNDTATTEIYTLSLHDALPIYPARPDRTALPGEWLSLGLRDRAVRRLAIVWSQLYAGTDNGIYRARSEEHTSELQSQSNIVCRLLLEKKKRDTPSTVSSPPRST